MGDRRSTPSSARERYYKRRVKRTGLLVLVALLMAVVVCGALVYPVLAPDAGVDVSQFKTPTAKVTLPATQTSQPTPTETATPEPDLTKTLAALPTQGQIVPPSEDSHILVLHDCRRQFGCGQFAFWGGDE